MLSIAGMLDGRKIRQRKHQVDVEEAFADAETIHDQVCRRNQRYRLKMDRNQHGLIRLTITDRHLPLGQKPGFEGCSVRELYTYNRYTASAKLSSIMLHANPPDYCDGLVTAWNCLDPKGPISLDSTPLARVAHVPNQPPLAMSERSA